MSEVYRRLIAALEWDDGSGAAARAALQALRDPGAEVREAGIDPAHWSAAIDALLRAADAAELAERMSEAEARRQRWPSVHQELRRLGCRVWQLNGNDDQWRIDGPAVHVEMDLVSGEVDGLDGPYDEAQWTLEELLKTVRGRVSDRLREEALEALRSKLRETHTWVNGKGWVPNDGRGPIIRRASLSAT